MAIIGKNSAHWILADLAILMAGHVSVPRYPTFNGEALAYILKHSEARACFIGKMDDISNLQTGVAPGLPLIALPLAPTAIKATLWNDLIAQTPPLQGSPSPDGESICTIIYTSGTTAKPKGVVHTGNAMAWGIAGYPRQNSRGKTQEIAGSARHRLAGATKNPQGPGAGSMPHCRGRRGAHADRWLAAHR
ncbi:AMP-binding protein [Rhodoferax sp. UBA5149]|uniref:AMP-binding protein n=1 Tax=Rhodoferax sp. UBA5149 TaxID=1947379 RepID=UPI002600C7B8|nr:AMP-binding protein [Rhodoferax sp. UBA5149]